MKEVSIKINKGSPFSNICNIFSPLFPLGVEWNILSIKIFIIVFFVFFIYLGHFLINYVISKYFPFPICIFQRTEGLNLVVQSSSFLSTDNVFDNVFLFSLIIT